MTIQTSYTPISYAGDNVTNSFAIVWQYQLASQIVASTEVIATGVVTDLVYGTDFSVSPLVNSPAATGTLVLLNGALPSGTEITITRNTALVQDTSWINNSVNPASAFENAVDWLTMIDQEILQGGGTLPDSALGQGTSTTDTFLRGGSPRAWSNTLIGPSGPFTLPADTTALLVAGQAASASIKVVGGAASQSAFSFGVDGSVNPWDARWVYDPTLPAIGWQFFGGPLLGTFTSAGLDVTGTVNAGLFTGHADASLIDSGTIALARLGTNSPGANTALFGDNTWKVISGGGGGINTTTTGTFTMHDVALSQTVPVTATTGINVGTYLLISDGTHTLIGHVTNIASLNLTVVTDSIPLGAAGNTMASGAAVQSSGVPGQNIIQIEDGLIPSTAMSTLTLTGSSAAAESGIVPMYIFASSGGNVTVKGYIGTNTLAATAINANPGVGAGVVGVASNVAASGSQISPTAVGQVLLCNSFSGIPHGITWGLVGPTNITTASLTPALLNSTNSLTNGYVPSYDSGTGNFTWVANGGSIPGGGDAGKFFRGDNTFSQILDISLDSNPAGFLLAQGTANGNFGTTFGVAADGSQAFWSMQKKATGTWGGPTGVWTNYVIGSGDLMTLSLQTTWPGIDSTPGIEQLRVPQMVSVGYGVRSIYGPLWKIYQYDGPATSITIDLANGAYQRLTNFVNNVSITMADTTPVPSLMANAYASELTLEISRIQSTFSVDITWPGTITWINGGVAPTVANGGLTATGFNIIRLVRVQNTGIANGGGARWFGFVENATGTTYTDAQARSAVLSSTYLINSATIAMNVVAGTSTTPAIINSSITNTHISSSANIAASKLAGYPGNSSLFLNGTGGWTVPPGGGGGGGPTLAGNNNWSGVNNFANTGSFSGKQTFNGPQVFTSSGFNSPVGSLAVGQASFNNSYPNDNLNPEFAATARFTMTNSYLGGSTQEILGLSVTQTNNSVTGGEGQGCVKFYNEMLQNITSGFSIAMQEVASFRQVNGGIADGVWLNAWSPCAEFAATPDATGVIHSFGSGAVRIGEVNYGNAWADLGFIDDRGISKFVAGLEFFPDWLPGSTGATTFTKFNASWAIAIGGAGARAGSGDPDPKNWTGILFSENGIAPLGVAINMHGGSSSGNAPAVGINFQNHLKTGINFAGSAGGAPIGTGGGTAATIDPETISGHSNQPAIILAQGQAICFSPPTTANTGVYIVYDGTHLKATINGGNTFTNII